ncbi:hypothetical protein [Vulcanisaeta souniana]|uniref:Uncharacterized protein n=1 Tax=Vulcanisaeta souniana JCM 11219 TaxID=1293586 RepID=A0A830EBT0_9CREN|nr:hypothetical protein [Vulcanisaeta souniana]BDR92963.1 hypothetical protein Vsou_20560 [Vulcanisaeta souniana JCM 11219]GGI83879.1 hypothetical protein GCM10007112_20940 [Vulcanisaeta souniana JCM 11219]
MHNYNVIEALTEEYGSRLMKTLQQVCRCKHEYERNRELLRLLSINDRLSQCIKTKTPCNLGFIEVRTTRKFFGTQVVIVMNGRELSIDEFNKLISAAKFFKEWYENDCSIDIYMQPLIGADHYDQIKEFLVKNLDKLQTVCDGAIPSLSLNGLPIYVSNGIIKAMKELTRKA